MAGVTIPVLKEMKIDLTVSIFQVILPYLFARIIPPPVIETGQWTTDGHSLLKTCLSTPTGLVISYF